MPPIRTTTALMTIFLLARPVQSISQEILPGFGVIQGRVADDEGNPVGGAIVTLYPGPGRVVQGRMPFVGTDARGRFVFSEVRPGPYILVASQKKVDNYLDLRRNLVSTEDFTKPTVTVRAQHMTPEVVIRFDPEAFKLVGQILDADTGRAVPSAKMEVRRRQDSAGVVRLRPNLADARFQLLLPPRIALQVKVMSPGYATWCNGTNSPQACGNAIVVPPDATKQMVVRLRPTKRP